MKENRPSKPALELRHENGKVLVYENEQRIKSFTNELMALGFINRLKFERMALQK